MHQNNAQAAKVGQQGKPESYYFPPQLNAVGNNFPYTFFGLEPGTTKDDIRRCLERWNEGDNVHPQLHQGVPPATGHRLAGAALRPARARLAGHLRAAMGFRRVRHVPVAWSRAGRCPGACSSRTCPRTSTTISITSSSSSTGRATSIRTSRIAIISNRSPWPTRRTEGYVDRWIVYGKVDGEQLFTAKELTVDPGVKVTIKDNGAYGLIAVQGSGRIGKLPLQTPAMIRFGELTEDEVFVTARRRPAGRRLREHRPRAAGHAALLRTGHEPGRAECRRP